MGYELFKNRAHKFGSPQLTIRGGRIFFNADAGDLLAKTGMKYIHVLWDAEERKLAIRPIAKQDGNAFAVSFKKGRRGGTFSVGSFLKYIQWRADESVVVPILWNEKEHLFEASLPIQNVGVTNKDRGARRTGALAGRRQG